jgi:hypothetical protein
MFIASDVFYISDQGYHVKRMLYLKDSDFSHIQTSI